MDAQIQLRWMLPILFILSLITFTPHQCGAEGIPLNTIKPFFNNSLILPVGLIDRAPAIKGLDDQHLLVPACFRFFATVRSPVVGEKYGVYKAGKKYMDPRKKCVCLGQEAILLGKARLIEAGCGGYYSTFMLEEAIEEIKVEDRLFLYCEPQRPACIKLREPTTTSPCGFIAGTLSDTVNQIGQYSVVVITGGQDEGRQFGDVLGIYHKKRDEQPRLKWIREFNSRKCNPPNTYVIFPQHVGDLMIFKVFEKSSFGLVTNSFRPIYLQDEVK